MVSVISSESFSHWCVTSVQDECTCLGSLSVSLIIRISYLFAVRTSSLWHDIGLHCKYAAGSCLYIRDHTPPQHSDEIRRTSSISQTHFWLIMLFSSILYIKRNMSVCLSIYLSLCLSVCFSVPYARPQLWAGLDLIWHTASVYPPCGHGPVSERYSRPHARAPPLQMGGKLHRGIRN